MVGGKGAALRLPERSGGGRKAALRELHWRLVFQRGVRTLMVVVLAVLLAEHFRLQHAGEGFAVQELIAEPAVDSSGARKPAAGSPKGSAGGAGNLSL